MKRTLFTLIAAALLLVSCGSDDSGPSEPDNPRAVDVSTSNDGISVRRIMIEGNDLPLLCVIYNKTGGSDYGGKYGQGSGIDCNWNEWNLGPE